MKNLTILLLVLSSQIINAQFKDQTKLEKKRIEDVIQNKADLISESHQNLINIIFQEAPIYTLKLQGAYKKTQQILKELNDAKELELKSSLKNKTEVVDKDKVEVLKLEILKPIEQLIPLLHRKAYRFLNEPLFVELLLDEDVKDKIKSKTRSDKVTVEDINKILSENEIPVGIKFLNTDSKKASTFFFDYIQDKDTLLNCASEFDKLFGPFNRILTEETKQKAVNFYKELIAKAKKK
jgi:hypothetical protein